MAEPFVYPKPICAAHFAACLALVRQAHQRKARPDKAIEWLRRAVADLPASRGGRRMTAPPIVIADAAAAMAVKSRLMKALCAPGAKRSSAVSSVAANRSKASSRAISCMGVTGPASVARPLVRGQSSSMTASPSRSVKVRTRQPGAARSRYRAISASAAGLGVGHIASVMGAPFGPSAMVTGSRADG